MKTGSVLDRASTAITGVLAERRHRGIDAPPVYVDVGSAGGMPFAWRRATAKGLVRAWAVDPQEDYGTRQGSTAEPIKCALGARAETRPFYETKFAQCSSCLEPNSELLKDYPASELFEVIGMSELKTVRADDYWAEHDLPTPDLIKIDVQGLELEVLQGFGALLDGVSAVEFEGHFRPMYKGQALIPALSEFMNDRGFRLRHLEPQGPFEGEVIEANLYWEDLNRLPARVRYNPLDRYWA
jgi:FkbM family methyltransferase